MERLTGNQAKSLMEAYAQVYAPSQSGKQLLSEQQTQLPSWLNGMSIDEYNKKYIEKYRSGVYKPPLKPGETPYDRQMALDRRDVEQFGRTASGESPDRVRARIAQTKPERPAPARPAPAPAKTFKVGDKQMTKAQINTEYQRLKSSKDPKERASAEQFGKDANRAIFKPVTATTSGGTKFERRTPTSAELKAAQDARAAGEKDPDKVLQKVKSTPTSTSTTSSTTSTTSATNTAANNLSGSGALAGKSPTGTGTIQGSSLRSEIENVRNKLQQRQQSQPQPQTQSVDLFDIIKGEFINEGYSEEDTMYMMSNLNEEQLQEFWRQLANTAIKNANKIPGVRGVVSKVGRMFGRTPVPTQVPSGQVGALRLYQDKANQSIQRLNQQTTRLNNRAATRATQREADRLNNLDPRAVGERNAREAAAQVRARNRELGRPEWAPPQPVDSLNYKPGDPKFTKSLQQYYADKRSGVKGLD